MTDDDKKEIARLSGLGNSAQEIAEIMGKFPPHVIQKRLDECKGRKNSLLDQYAQAIMGKVSDEELEEKYRAIGAI